MSYSSYLTKVSLTGSKASVVKMLNAAIKNVGNGDTIIVLISEMNVFAHYSYVLGDKYDDLLKRGDYEDINQDRKNLVLDTYKILKMLLRKNIV